MGASLTVATDVGKGFKIEVPFEYADAVSEENSDIKRSSALDALLLLLRTILLSSLSGFLLVESFDLC